MKFFTVVNILGLAMGIFASYIIIKYVSYELSFDGFHNKAGNIYRISMSKIMEGGAEYKSASTFSATGPAVKNECPEIIDYFRLKPHKGVISYENISFGKEALYFADPSIVKILTFNFLKGNNRDAFFTSYSSIISESVAKKLFGDESPLGKIIVLDGIKRFFVDGVYKDFPENSHLQPKVIFSYEALLDWAGQDAQESWTWDQFYIYCLVNKKADIKELTHKLERIPTRYPQINTLNKSKISFQLQPLQDIHLNSHLANEPSDNGKAYEVYFLMLLAGVILLIALLNHVNLSTVFIINRTLEIGVRKVFGASKKQITSAFAIEWLAINFVPVLIAIIVLKLFGAKLLTHVGLPEKILHFTQLDFILLALFFIAATFSTIIYPYLFTGRLKVLTALFEQTKFRFSTSLFKKGLIVFQFLISFILIVGSIVMHQQIHLMKTHDLGFNINQVLVLPTSKVVNYEKGYVASLNAFKHDLLKNAFIKNVAVSSSLPGHPIFRAGQFALRGKSEIKTFKYVTIDDSYFNAFNIQLLAGSFFHSDVASNKAQIIINESAAQLLGFNEYTDAIAREVTWGDKSYEIKGVVKNYYHSSPKKFFEPIAYVSEEYVIGSIFIKLDTKNLHEKLLIIKKIWEEYFPGNPFDFFFLNEHFNNQYKKDISFSKTINLFALLAIFTACLGLLGFSSVIVVERQKEIGIRKIIGASLPNILYVLSKDFLALVITAILIAIPLSYILLSQWLQGFALRVTLDISTFIFPGLILILIALLTIAYYIIQAAKVNPVKFLRSN